VVGGSRCWTFAIAGRGGVEAGWAGCVDGVKSQDAGLGSVWLVVIGIRGRRRGVGTSDQSASDLVAILLSRACQMPKQS